MRMVKTCLVVLAVVVLGEAVAAVPARATNCVCRLYHVSHNPTGFCQFYSSFCVNGVMTFGPYDDAHPSLTGQSCNVNCNVETCRELAALAGVDAADPIPQETPAALEKYDTKLLLVDENTTKIVAVRFATIDMPSGKIHAKLYRMLVDPPDDKEELPSIYFEVGFEIEYGGLGKRIIEYVNGKFKPIDIVADSYQPGKYAADDKLGPYMVRVAVGGIKYTIHTNKPVD